jgi:hypothetical protein
MIERMCSITKILATIKESTKRKRKRMREAYGEDQREDKHIFPETAQRMGQV